jgi:hypothetical protein
MLPNFMLSVVMYHERSINNSAPRGSDENTVPGGVARWSFWPSMLL